jgi:hypothetical protein
MIIRDLLAIISVLRGNFVIRYLWKLDKRTLKRYCIKNKINRIYRFLLYFRCFVIPISYDHGGSTKATII